MKSSLRSTLNSLIEEKGYLSYGDMCQFVAEWEYKVETATRRLRYLCAPIDEKGNLQTPHIKPTMGKGKRTGAEYINGWEWINSSRDVLLAQGSRDIAQKETLSAISPPEKEKIGFVTIAGKRIEIYK